ncbi:MAG TPA: DnaD domain protein [Candidatus Cottocaccamicrobium excrementipullorum]|nr:DnaD domain protein [Candidatus Cottocaccamicrobium excrementipullorum]
MKWEMNSGFQVDATLVANRFIDEYMAGASGEYVKIYLYLLRHQNSQTTTAETAEALHCTEGDVKRAVAYWQKAGVLKTAGPEKQGERAGRQEGESSLGKGQMPSQGFSMEQVSRLSRDEDFSQLLYIAQKYMNKAFSQRECQVFAYLYGELKLPVELLEYLVEYCVQNGHTSIRYMETVAVNWHQKGLVTLEAAKAYSAGFNKDYFAVMKAFGLTDRRPAEAERKMMETWFGAYGFTREVVLEACNRTIEATHSPSFKYADKILSQWKQAGVKNLSDVEDLDMIRKSQEKEKDQAKGRGQNLSARTSKTTNRFHNFQQSSTDYDSLMMEKVRARMKE